MLRLTNKNKKCSYYQRCLTRVRGGQEVEILKLKSNAPRLTYLNGFQSHLKIKRCILRLGGEFHALHLLWMRFKPIRRCIPQLGGGFRTLHLVLVYFLVPRLWLVNELGASARFVGNHATQVARVPRVQPLDTWVQRVAKMWFAGILTGSVFIADDLYSTNPEDCGCFKQGLHTVTLLVALSQFILRKKMQLPCPAWKRKSRISVVKIAASMMFNYERSN